MKTPDDFRRHASDLRKAVDQLDPRVGILEDVDTGEPYFNLNIVVPLIVGHLEAKMLDALAAQTEYLQSQGYSSRIPKRTQEILDTNDAIRTAAANGDWDKYNEIISGRSDSGRPGGTGEDQQPT